MFELSVLIISFDFLVCVVSAVIVAESCLTVCKVMLVGAYGMGTMMRHLI